MKICARSPIHPELTLCNQVHAYHAVDAEPFRFAREREHITCEQCLAVIEYCRETYTKTGKMRWLKK